MTAGVDVPTSARRSPSEPVDPSPSWSVTVVTRRVIPYALFAGVLTVAVRWASLPLSNFDTYFHLRFGHEFLNGWSLRHPGHVTSYATAEWVPTQWLPEVVMARTEDWFGLAGVAWLGGLQYVGLCVALLLAARRVADPIIAVPVVVVALIGCISGLSMRPQVLSYVFVVVTVTAWSRVHSTQRSRTPWLLVPLTWVWAMCHGMWPIGVVIGLAAVTGLALDRRRGRSVLVLLAVPGASALAAALLTPVGPALLPAVLAVNSRSEYFSEWGPPHFTDPQGLAVLLLLALALAIMARKGDNDWFTLLLVGLGGAFAAYSLRTLPVAACLLTPLVAAQLQRLMPDQASLRRREVVAILAAGLVCLGVLALVVPRTASRPPPQPAWLDPTMQALPSGTKILDDDIYGGYLMWRYPDLDILFSGYGDIYTTSELRDTRDIGSLAPDWPGLVRQAHPAYALVSRRSPLAYALRTEEHWRVVHDDEQIVMLQPPPGWFSDS